MVCWIQCASRTRTQYYTAGHSAKILGRRGTLVLLDYLVAAYIGRGQVMLHRIIGQQRLISMQDQNSRAKYIRTIQLS